MEESVQLDSARYAARTDGARPCAGDGGDVEDRVHMDGAVEAIELAIGSFLLAIAQFVEIAFDDHFGIGGRENAVGDARTSGTGSPRKVPTRPNSSTGTFAARRQEIEGVRADGEADRELFLALDAGEIGAFKSEGATGWSAWCRGS